MTGTHILKDKTVNLAYRMYLNVRHKFLHRFYHQILVLAGQHLLLVTGKRFVDEYFSSGCDEINTVSDNGMNMK